MDPGATRPVPRGSRIWMQAVLATVVAASIGLYAWRSTGAFGEWIYVVGTGFPAVVAVAGLRLHPPGPRRTTWTLVAAGIAASAAGDAVYAWLSVAGRQPDVSLADVGWLASYVLLALGLFRLVMGGDRRGLDVDALIDMAVIAAVGIVVLWEQVLSGTFGDRSVSPFVRTVWGAYPILDAALLALVVRLVMSSRGRSVPALLVTGGVACWLASDFAYIVADGGDVGIGFNAGWIVGAALIGASVLSGQHTSHGSGPGRPGRTGGADPHRPRADPADRALDVRAARLRAWPPRSTGPAPRRDGGADRPRLRAQQPALPSRRVGAR